MRSGNISWTISYIRTFHVFSLMGNCREVPLNTIWDNWRFVVYCMMWLYSMTLEWYSELRPEMVLCEYMAVFPNPFFHIYSQRPRQLNASISYHHQTRTTHKCTPGWESLEYVCSCMRDKGMDMQTHPGRFMAVPTLYFWFSKEIVDSSPTSFFLFSPTKSAATCAGRTFSRRRRFRFSHSSTSSLSAWFLFFNRKSWRQQYSFWEEDRRL